MHIETRIVDDRVFLLGLDQHYRGGMKLFEARVLFDCAKAVAGRLGVGEANVPLEGYYAEAEIPELPKYFRLMRALQDVTEARGAATQSMPELKRILEITGSAMYGRAQYERNGERMLLPTGRDAFSEALRGLLPADCNVPALTGRARDAALAHDDISLVGLAARAGDPVVLAALRESVVLYAEKILLLSGGLEYRYEWRVDPELARSANRFIEIYNRLVAGPNAALPAGARAGASFEWCASLPIPQAEARHAPHFYDCAEDNEILGRCVHVATRYDTREKYHWAVRGASGGQGLEVDDFWSDEIWTTARYRSEKRPGGTLRRGGGGIGNLEIV